MTTVSNLFKVRCSELPLLFSCANSIRNPDKLVQVRIENDAALLGTAIHTAIQHTAETGEVDLGPIEANNTPPDIARGKELFLAGLRAVQDAKVDMLNPQFEVEVSFETKSFMVTGHVDVLDVQPTRAYLLDFKTGRTRDNHYHQLVGYGIGAWARSNYPDDFRVYCAYIYLESGEVTAFELDVPAMRKWIKDLDALPESYQVNRKCIYCPLNNSCPAFREYLAGSMKMLLDISKLDDPSLRKLSPAARAKLTTALKMSDIAVKRIRENIKDEAIKHGDIDMGNGNAFTIRMRSRQSLITSRALPVLAEYLTPKGLASITTLNLSDVLAEAAAGTKGVRRAIVRDELMTKLRNCGALVTHTSPYLETITCSSTVKPSEKSPRQSLPPKKRSKTLSKTVETPTTVIPLPASPEASRRSKRHSTSKE